RIWLEPGPGPAAEPGQHGDADRDAGLRLESVDGWIRCRALGPVRAAAFRALGGSACRAVGGSACRAVGAATHLADTDHPAHRFPQLRIAAVGQRGQRFAGWFDDGQLLKSPRRPAGTELRTGPAVVTWVGAGLTGRIRV